MVNYSEVGTKLIVLPLTREWIEIESLAVPASSAGVLPLTREWIEMVYEVKHLHHRPVLPLTREWIEIPLLPGGRRRSLSFSLLRGSGLKSASIGTVDVDGTVLPLTREWIEMRVSSRLQGRSAQSSPSYEGVD